MRYGRPWRRTMFMVAKADDWGRFGGFVLNCALKWGIWVCWAGQEKKEDIKSQRERKLAQTQKKWQCARREWTRFRLYRCLVIQHLLLQYSLKMDWSSRTRVGRTRLWSMYICIIVTNVEPERINDENEQRSKFRAKTPMERAGGGGISKVWYTTRPWFLVLWLSFWSSWSHLRMELELCLPQIQKNIMLLAGLVPVNAGSCVVFCTRNSTGLDYVDGAKETVSL